MDYELNGLPLHILLVHAVAVFIPLTALCILLHMFWPAARRRLGIVTPGLGLVTLVFVFLAQQAGEWLLLRVGTTPAITTHAVLGRGLLPWAWALFGASVAVWLWHRVGAGARLRRGAGAVAARVVGVVVVLGMAAICALAVVQVFNIGESGSRAVWGGSFSNTPVQR
ncbi:hypothetical protein [Specibacter cremeus]|uniref:hypothetical protein n=1 Tax=Specibacter cremeus TaxID=1629051 RepID=UPI000F793540|nr:hypothetical protein [Specibacter cremeus]